MLRKIEKFIREKCDCTDEERIEIEMELDRVRRKIFGLQNKLSNYKEKEEKRYKNIPWR